MRALTLSVLIALLCSCSGVIGSGNQAAQTDALSVFTGMRRLTNREYRNTIRDLFGFDDTTLQRVTQPLPAIFADSGFDNAVTKQNFAIAQGIGYRDTAELIAAELVGNTQQTQTLLGCIPSGATRAACIQTLLGKLGRRIFRRPLSNTEIMRFTALDATQTDANEGLKLILQAFLQSPFFLYRVERGISTPAGESDPAGYKRLSGFEVAARLSYLLWVTTPDDALLDKAEQGILDKPEGIQAVAQDMLNDPRSSAALNNFTEQWLLLGALNTVQRASGSYDQTLATSMRAELDRLLKQYLWTPNANFLDLYTFKSTQVDRTLATIYDVPAPNGTSLSTVDFTNNPNRGGFFSTAGFLTLSNRSPYVSNIQRGVYMRKIILCSPPPAPPPGIAPTMPMDGESATDAETRHTSDPVCANCHKLIDPVGYGLERYDVFGKLATNGGAATKTGTFDGLATPNFNGGFELGQRIRESDLATTCVTQKFIDWATGGAYDDDQLRTTLTAFKQSNNSFVKLVTAYIQDQTFRYRKDD